MMKLLNTIAGQLILLIVGAILLSQAIIVLVFFFKTDARIEEYEDQYISKHIAAIYDALQPLSDAKREELLPIVSNAEILFSISKEPIGEELLTPAFTSKYFTGYFQNITVYRSVKMTTLQDIFFFWFSNEEDGCLTGMQPVDKMHDCPYLNYSFRLNDGQWLNTRMDPPLSELILLMPVLVSVFVTIIGITLAVIFAVKRITAPLHRLSYAADQFGRGETIEQLDIHGPKELSSTINAFNIMHERLTRFIQDRTKMLAAISHDLRTPITSLRLRTEFIKDKDLQGKMINTLEDMRIMVDACLTFSKQDVLEEESKIIDLVQTLEELAEDSSHISFFSTIPSYDYSCRSVNIKRTIRNLLENAVKYGEKAHMVFEKNDTNIIITIQDQGTGVPENRLEEIFEPFTRLDKARNTESGNVGLGLSIARTIIHKHGGTITATNTTTGLNMSVVLPIHPY